MRRGTTSCELKRAWGLSEHSERFPAQAKWLRSNTHREGVRERTEETDGRPCSQRDLLGITQRRSIWPTRVNIQQEAFQVRSERC